MADGIDDGVAAVLAESDWPARIEHTPADLARLAESRRILTGTLAEGEVYGTTSGFGPLVGYPADRDRHLQGSGLIRHLAVGQGDPLPPRVTRTMVWLRLRSMAHGYSAVDPDLWCALVEQWNAGFTPVVPRDGSLSASGDLIPLAHAALAAAGSDTGQRAWRGQDESEGSEAPSVVLRRLGVPPVAWEARTALAFVNGSSACLAVAMHNHRELWSVTRLAAAATGRLATLLGSDAGPYGDPLNQVRNQPGQRLAARWIRAELPGGHRRDPLRPLQERYSLRCAPQVLGAVVDQLRAQGEVLVREARGCTDNPVFVAGAVHHGGNFHAAPVALASEMHGSCVQQVALLMERQLALVVDPASNGGKPPLLSASPGASSGLAGVQIAASAHLSRIRQLAYPASMTTMPSNLDNQDHTPLALNSATAVAEMLRRLHWIAGSLLLAITQFAHLAQAPATGLWQRLREAIPALARDRPLSAEITEAVRIALASADRP